MWLSLVLVGIVSFFIYLLLKPSKSYWKQYGVREFSGGGIKKAIEIFLGKTHSGLFDMDIYRTLGPSDKFAGYVQMAQPTFLVKDLETAKQILIKDFDYFVDRRAFVNGEETNIMNKMLTNLSGDTWKNVRAGMSPAFTTGKIRRMMEHMNGVGHTWVKHFNREITSSKDYTDINVINEVNRYTVDVIAAAGFGIKPDTIDNRDSYFFQMVQKITKIDWKQLMKFAVSINFPGIVRFFGISVIEPESTTFFANLSKEGMKARQEGKEKRNDFIQLIVEAKKGELKAEREGRDDHSQFEKDAEVTTAEKKNYLVEDDYGIAQLVLFFFAGFSTTANFIAFVIYLLALHPEVQQKLRKEIDEKLFGKGEEDINYDVLNGLVYLDMVVCEVLRTYPPAARLERKCVKEYQLEGENVRIPKGTLVAIPTHAIHHDDKYYEKPNEFYPEHFTPDQKAKRDPYAFMPFGSGPRNCIGMRFALVESKAAIAHLVHNFRIEKTPTTPDPVKVKNIVFGVQVPDNLEVRLRKVK